ncbi:MAG TPA: ATP-binding protein, partial [Kofleriaceae bacterium]|nr:ATP-binding protein [Kofleriaceae bacterium]
MAKRSDPPRPQQRDRGRTDDDPVVSRLRRHLEFLGLTRTRDQLDELLAWSAHERPGATALLEHILGLEAAHKLEQRITRRIDTSGLVERKSLEAFDWDFQPSLDKSLVLELARLDFVRRHDDLVVTGNNGTGKSHLLKAFALRACEQGLHMRYARCVDLLDDLHAGLADGTYARRLKGWARPALLIIDDVGLGQVKRRAEEPTAAHTLYNLVDRRHGHASTAVTTNQTRYAPSSRKFDGDPGPSYWGASTVGACALDQRTRWPRGGSCC